MKETEQIRVKAMYTIGASTRNSAAIILQVMSSNV